MYASAPELVTDQPPFLNAVVEVELSQRLAELGPRKLLEALKALEAPHEKSAVRFGPRELDLDIVAYGDDIELNAADGSLTVPHPRAHQRDFVLRPLCELERGRHVRLGPSRKRAVELLDERAAQGGAEAGRCYPVRNALWSPRRYDLGRVDSDLLHPQTMVMGILNVTPDSFSDGGQFLGVEAAVARAVQMCAEGADVVDVGGESTRPNAVHVELQEELDRVLPVIERLAALDGFTSSISIDTRKAEVARAAVAAGAHIINDQVGELDDESESMLAAAADMGAPLITMHARGDARTMETKILGTPGAPRSQQVDIVEYVREWLEARATKALEGHGVARWNVMIDPGLGFAKTSAQSLELLSRLDRLCGGGRPVLVGASRKRFLRPLAQFDIDAATGATSAVAGLAGSAMVRVHNVRATVDALRVADAVRRARSE